MVDVHKNLAYSTVATAPSPATSGTSLVVATGHGTRFPAVPFNATIWPTNAVPTPANAEIVRVTNISTDTLTITRAQESTSARTVIVGDQIAATITAKTLTDIENSFLVSAGVSNIGNTSGNTGLTAQTLVFSGGNNVTLSQSTNASGATIGISGPSVPTLNRWENLSPAGSTNPLTNIATVQTTMIMAPLGANDNYFPGNMTVKTLFLNMSGSHTNTSSFTANQSFTCWLGIYTISASSTLNLLNSASSVWAFNAAVSMSSNFNGPRFISFHSSLFNAALTFSQTNYYVGLLMSSGGNAAQFSMQGQYVANTAQRSGTVGVSTVTATTLGLNPYVGVIATAALPASVNINALNHAQASAGFMPHLILEALNSAF